MSQSEIKEIEMSIDAAKEIVERGERAMRLSQNPDFKKVVMDGYFVDEAARLVHLYSDPNISEEIRGHVHRDLLGIGAMKRHLSTLVQMGVFAKNEINESREVLDEIRASEIEGANE